MVAPPDDRVRTRPVSAASRRHDPAADVAAARAAVRRTQVTYDSIPPRRPPRATLPDQLRAFVRRYGWRAYALPILTVITVVALLSSTSPGVATNRPLARTKTSVPSIVHSTAAVAPPRISLRDDEPGSNVIDTAPAGSALPRTGGAYTRKGNGTFRTLVGSSKVVGHGQTFRYSIDVENGVRGIDLAQFAGTVVRVLSDRRSWSGHGVALQRVDSGPVDFHVTLTSALTVRRLCGYTLRVEASCFAAADSSGGSTVNRVVLDDARWVRGATAYTGDVPAYRIYMINHEDGHALGHEHAHQCLAGGVAPVMMQQTFGLRSAAGGHYCSANPWPYPPGVKGAPGAEQPDTDANDEYYLGD